MELQQYLSILRKRWTIVVAITLLSTIASGLISYFVIKPTYKSDISVIIQKTDTIDSKNAALNYSDVLLYQQLVKTYSEFARSRTVAEHAIEKLNLNIKPDQLLGMISVAPKGNTEFLTITVKSNDAQQAMEIANQLAWSLKAVSTNIKKSDNVQILDSALIPTSPDSPRLLLNVAVAFFLGLMLAIGIIFIIEYLDNTIKTPEDIEKLIDIPVIGTIPYVAEAKK